MFNYYTSRTLQKECACLQFFKIDNLLLKIS